MFQRARTLLWIAPLVLPLVPAPAQVARSHEIGGVDSRSASVIRRSFGAFVAEEGISAMGPGYVARFARGGFEFTPVLGERAPRDYPIRFALESIRRGKRTFLEALPSTLPEREGNFIRFARGKGVVECYESRVDGVEQSFLFAYPPAGSGDLIVRGSVTTELRASSVDGTAEPIHFEIPQLGGVSWGSVVGIDARGARASGRLRLDGTHLELLLPGEFVDRAAFPLLLDPLIGSFFSIASGSDNDYVPDVAYDATNQLYLAVWHRRYSASNRVIFGQRFRSSGTMVGPPIQISVASGNNHSPAVANVNAADRFLVMYAKDPVNVGLHPNIGGALVNASDGLVSSSFISTWGSTVGADPRVDVGADSNSLYAFVVFSSATGGIHARRAYVPPVGALTFGPTVFVSTSPGDQTPAITKHGGSAGRFLIAWERPTANGNNDLYARVIDVGGALLTAETVVSADAVAEEAKPDCATPNGTGFAIVYERHNSGPSGTGDIAFRSATHDSVAGTLSVSPESILAGGSLVDQREPAIDFAAAKYLVVWAAASLLGGGFNLNMVGLDPAGARCDPVITLNNVSGWEDRFPQIAAEYSSGGATDEAIVVWEAGGSTGDVRGQRVEAMGAGGSVTQIGGGCAGGGTTGVRGPAALGNASFAFTLGGASGPEIALVIGVSALNFACGGCTLVPALDLVLTAPSPIPFPIPCQPTLFGATVYAQWIVQFPGSCPLAPDFALSMPLRVVIGL